MPLLNLLKNKKYITKTKLYFFVYLETYLEIYP